MLRSMIIGLGIAALLQFGGHALVPAADVSLAAKRIDWVAVQTDAVAHLLCSGVTQLTR